MIRRHFLFLLLLSSVEIRASDSLQEQARHAAVYVAARQYDRALEIYHDLPQEQLNEWQRATVLYNIGTILVAQQRWDAAIQTLEQVPMSDDSSPLLRRRGYYNLAVALLGLAKSQMYLYAIDDPSFLDRSRAFGEILQRAWSVLDKADKAACELRQIEGGTTCQVPFDIAVARQRTKQLQSNLYELQRQNRFVELSFAFKISRLLIILGANERWLEHVTSNDDALADAQTLAQLAPLWTIAKSDMITEHLSDQYLQSRRIFLDSAFTQYQEGVVALDQGGLVRGRDHIKAAGYWLRGVLELEIGDEIEALLKIQTMANVIGNNSADFTQALDALTQSWLKNSLRLLPAVDPKLADEMTAALKTQPARALLLYRIVTRNFGAIIADLLQTQPLNLPRVSEQLETIQQYGMQGSTADQRKTLQNALEVVSRGTSDDDVRQILQTLAITWDLNGFLQELIGQLFEDYLLRIARRELVVEGLQRLGARLEQLKHFMELPEVGKMAGAAGPIIAENIGNAMADHVLGIQALQGHQVAVARIFFGEVTYWLGSAERRSLGVVSNTPEPLLRVAVGEEQHAMQVVSAVMELPEDQRQPASPYAVPLHEAMRLAQKQALAWAAPFVGVVLAHQREVFEADGKGDSSCQRYPWEEVLPLYFLGEAAADKASDSLAGAVTSLSSVLSDQKVAYRKWLKALEMLQQGNSKAAATKKQTLEQPETVSGTQMLSTSIDEILRQLQQMDRQDSTEQRGQQPVQAGGGKPW